MHTVVAHLVCVKYQSLNMNRFVNDTTIEK